MGNKEEITNLIGRKGSKMTVKSNVKTLALKVYDEQIPDGWEKLKERIKELKKQNISAWELNMMKTFLETTFLNHQRRNHIIIS